MVEGAVLLKAQENAGPTPLLSDYAVGREAMYEGRDD